MSASTTVKVFILCGKHGFKEINGRKIVLFPYAIFCSISLKIAFV